MAGRLIYLMGPSGAGKDTVLLGLSSLLGSSAYLASRVVTRSSAANEPASVPVTMAEFEYMEACGWLAMAWRANGLAYGVLRDINDRLVAGCDILLNGSRAYLPEARRRYADLVPVLLDVKPDLLHQRLHARGREDAYQIRQRLQRNESFEDLATRDPAKPVLVVDNSHDVDRTIQTLYAHLKPFDADEPVCHLPIHNRRHRYT